MKIQENISFLLSESNNQCNETPQKLKKPNKPQTKTKKKAQPKH